MMKFNTRESKRLFLKSLTMDDLMVVHELNSIPEVDKFNTLGLPENLEVTRKIVRDRLVLHQLNPITHYSLSVFLKSDNSYVGMAGFFVGRENYKDGEIYYRLHPKYWNKGFATEIAQELIDFGFKELNLHRIKGGCAIGNKASARVLEKVGMQLEGTMREALPLKSGWSDCYEFAILRTDPR